MGKRLDITGQRFGRLVAIRPVGSRNGKILWRCICDCGKFYVTAGSTLQLSKCRSCPCRKTNYRHGYTPKHGPHHPLYVTWAQIRNRCDNPNHTAYKYYGGRGIKYDPRWDDFPTFLTDIKELGTRPHHSYTLDRIDNDLNYFKENMRWASKKTQNNNRRSPQEWNRKRRRLDQFTIYELKTELARRRKLNQA